LLRRPHPPSHCHIAPAIPPGGDPSAPPKSPAPAEQASAAPDAVVQQLEAYMPEAIALYKLRGFVEEVGGQMIASEPGLIKVRLKAPKGGSSGMFSWLGLGKKIGPIDMELHMKKKDVKNQTVLQITVLLRPAGGGPVPDNPDWRDRCQIITQALKSYLMSHG